MNPGIYIISCGKLDKRYFLSKFMNSLNNTLVVYKKSNSLTKKQHKELNEKDIECIDLDGYDSDSIPKYQLIISYGLDKYADLLKLKDKFKSLIILHHKSSKESFTPSKSLISKKLEINEDSIFLLYSEGSKKFFYKVRDLNSIDSSFNFLTKDQTFTIINREIRLNKIIEK